MWRRIEALRRISSGVTGRRRWILPAASVSAFLVAAGITWAIYRWRVPAPGAPLEAEASTADAASDAPAAPSRPPPDVDEAAHAPPIDVDRARPLVPVRRGGRDVGPTRQALLRRIDDLLRRGRQAGIPPIALTALEAERQRVMEADDPTRKRAAAQRLSRWEIRFLPP